MYIYTEQKCKMFSTQKAMFDEMDSKSIPFKDGQYKFGYVSSHGELEKLILSTDEESRNFYEILKQGDSQYMYCDIDATLPFNNMSFEDIALRFNEIMTETFKSYDLKLNPKYSKYLTASNEDKLSIHWTYTDFVFQNSEKQKQFWASVILNFSEFNIIQRTTTGKVLVKNIIDMAVYTRNRAMRTIYSRKKGSNRVLAPFEINDKKIIMLNQKDIKLTDYFIYCPQMKHNKKLKLKTYDTMNYTEETIKTIILQNVPNVTVGSMDDKGLIKLTNTANRTCIINGETNISDQSYCLTKRDGIYFGCHNEECQGMTKQIYAKSLTSDARDAITEHFIAKEFIKKYNLLTYNDVIYYKNGYWRSDHKMLHTWLSEEFCNELLKIPFITDDDQFLINKLTTLKFCKTILEKVQILTNRDVNPFDNDSFLVGFENGVYDLKENDFRPYNDEDMISQTTGYNYEKPSKDDVRKLLDWFDKIMPLKDVRDFLLKVLSTSLYGHTLQNLVILTGRGGNGKDCLIDLLKDTLGSKYYYTGNSAVLQRPLQSGANPEIANLHKRRLVIYNEPTKQQKLCCATLKHLTGSSEVNARGLYMSNTTTLLKSTSIICSNEIPQLDNVDEAINRRLLVIQFRALFKTEDDMKTMPDTKYMYHADTYYTTQKFRDTYKHSMMYLLLKYFKKFANDGYLIKNLPPSVVDDNKEYTIDSDEFYMWFIETYEMSEDKKSFILTKDLHETYKNSDLWNDLTKTQRRQQNLKKIRTNIMRNPNLRMYYKERYQPRDDDNKKQNHRHVIVGWVKKGSIRHTGQDESDSDESDESDSD